MASFREPVRAWLLRLEGLLSGFKALAAGDGIVLDDSDPEETLVSANFGTTAGTVCEGNDPRLSSGSASTVSERWASPAAPHAFDQEFTGNSLPGSLGWWCCQSGGTRGAPTITGTPNLFNNGRILTAANMEVDYNARRSWVRANVAEASDDRFCLYHAPGSFTAPFTIRARVSLAVQAGGGGRAGLFVSNTVSGGPGMGVSGSSDSHIFVYLARMSGTLQLRVQTRSGGSDVVVQYFAAANEMMGDVEVGMTWINSNTVYSWAQIGSVFVLLDSARTWSLTGMTHWGLGFQNFGTLDRGAIHAADYMRYEATGNPAL